MRSLNRCIFSFGWIFCLLGHGGLSGCGGGKPTSTVPSIAITGPSGVEMVLLSGGTFTMGSDRGAQDEAPAHPVTISPLVMDVHEVYQAQYGVLQLPNCAHFKDPKRPIEMVRWSDAVEFCNERSVAEGLEPCYDLDTFACNFEATGYRLPSEAEWEYVARAGTDTDYSFGNHASQLGAYANFKTNSKKKTDLVGRKRPNSWGLYDMHGNVLEWCNDFYQSNYDSRDNAIDPRGPKSGKNKVLRGGSWKSASDQCRSSVRSSDNPGTSDACFAKDTYGFRCVRRPTSEELAQLHSGNADTPAE